MSIAQRPGVAACRVDGNAPAVLKSTGLVSVTKNGVGTFTIVTRERYSQDSIPMVGSIENDFLAFVEPQADPRTFVVFTKDPGFILVDTEWWFMIERIVT